MAFQSYISVKGTKRGQFTGESVKANRKSKWIEVISFGMGKSTPVDTTSGTAKGSRTHPPIVITKEWGAASPQLLSAHWTNEVLATVVIETVKPSASGGEQVYQRITLTNATIVSVRTYAGQTTRPGESSPRRRLDDVSFSYETLTCNFGAIPPFRGIRFGK